MKTPNSISEYIQQHPNFVEELTQLHDFLLKSGLTGEIIDGEPVYNKDETQILGFRAFEGYFNLWFKNNLDDEDFLKMNEEETKGLRQIPIKKGVELDKEFILSHMAAAIERLEVENKVEQNKISADLKNNSGETKDFNQLTKGKRVAYGDFIVKAKQDHLQTSKKKFIPEIKKGKA